MSRITIRDMIELGVIEKRLGRKITDMELEEEASCSMQLDFPDGTREFVCLTRLNFPYDLLSIDDDPTDVTSNYEEVIQQASQEAVQYSVAG